MRTARAALVILALAAMAFALAARRGPSANVEIERQPPPLAEPSAEPTAASVAVKVPRSTEAELERGMRRAFGGVVQPARTHPGLVGDFNGDGAEDLAMVGIHSRQGVADPETRCRLRIQPRFWRYFGSPGFP